MAVFENMRRILRDTFRPTRKPLEGEPPVKIKIHLKDGTVIEPQVECTEVDCSREAEEAKRLWDIGLGVCGIAGALHAPPSMIHGYLFGEDFHCEPDCPCKTRPGGAL